MLWVVGWVPMEPVISHLEGVVSSYRAENAGTAEAARRSLFLPTFAISHGNSCAD